jgi:hypothetical protein
MSAEYKAMMARRKQKACVQNTDENVFGKSRGKFNEEKTKKSCDITIQAIIWNFASLPLEYKRKCVEEFNGLHHREGLSYETWIMSENKPH